MTHVNEAKENEGLSNGGKMYPGDRYETSK